MTRFHRALEAVVRPCRHLPLRIQYPAQARGSSRRIGPVDNTIWSITLTKLRALRAIALLLLTYTLGAHAANNYVLVVLPHGVRMELPRNWEALSRNQRIALDSSVQARTESIGQFDASSDLNFAANFYDEAGKAAAIVNIRYYPEMALTQADARAAAPADVGDLDATIRSSLAQAGKVSGYTILKWFGTAPRTLSGTVAFITEYERSAISNNGAFRVRLVRILNGRSSFTITVSYRSNQEYLLRPICDRIIASIRP